MGEPVLTAIDLANTYSPAGTYSTPADAVEQYQAFLEAQGAHPEAGRNRLASIISTRVDDEIPPSRIRVWSNGGRPDAVRGIQTAEKRGWIPLQFDDAAFSPFNVLVAAIFGGGTISQESYSPSISIDNPTERETVIDAFDKLGVGVRTVRESDESRATELRPATDARVIGRILYALGAPIGRKNPEANLSLPSYLDEAPIETQKRFARTYLQFRLLQQSGKTVAQFREHRSRTYIRELAAFLDEVLDVEVSLSEKNIYLSTWPESVPTTLNKV